ncbi:MAG: PKD domain-containing protein [Bacteroidota bacterium]
MKVNICFLFVFGIIIPHSWTQNELQEANVIFSVPDYGRFWRNQVGIIDFSVVPPALLGESYDANTSDTHSGIFDADSDVFYFSNGSYVFTEPGDTIPGSDSLGWHPSYAANGTLTSGLPSPDMVLALPGFREKEISFFHQSTRWSFVDSLGGVIGAIDHLYLTQINTTATFPYAGVTLRDSIVYTDTLDPNIAAVRHGNGRDWWLIIGSRSGRNKHNVLLYDSMGIHPLEPQIFEPDGFISAISQSLFSPDGKYYARAKVVLPRDDPKVTIFLYEFDRCTGELKNQIYFDSPLDWGGPRFGLAFSPNSRFLYLSQASEVLQFDLESTDIESSYIVLFDYTEYSDSIIALNSFPYSAALAPDGKIYFGPLGGRPHYHSIKFPNLRGQASQFQYPDPDMMFPGFVSSGLPNFPPYGLGPLDGSPCDTLGISHPAPVAGFDQISSDSSTFVEFFDESSVYTIGWFWEFGDGETSTDRFPVYDFEVPGTYYTCLTATSLNGSNTYCDSIRVGVPAPNSLTEVGDFENLALFPNPTTGRVNVAISGLGHLRVFSSDGKLVLNQVVAAYQDQLNIDLSRNAVGLYTLVFIRDDGQIFRGRVVLDR